MDGGHRYKTSLTYLQNKLDTANALLRVVRVEGAIEIPSSLEEELRVAESQKAAAAKEFSGGHEEAAVSILSEAGDRMIKVVYEALRLCLLSPVQMIREEFKSFEKGDEDLIDLHIKKYDTHIENFQKIEELLDDWTLRGKRLELEQVRHLRKELEDFLKAIEIGKPKIAAVKARREEEKRERKEERKEDKKMSWISIGVGVAGVIAVIVFSPKGCSDSSQETSQPEATTSATEP